MNYKKIFKGVKFLTIMQLRDINWYYTSFHLTYHIILLISIPLYLIHLGIPSFGIIFSTILLYVVTMIGITAGYHRYFSHKSFTTNKIVEFFLLLSATMATQGSVFFWVHTHRTHHRYTDQELDPHNIKKGFWHAHMWWFIIKKHPLDKASFFKRRPIDKNLLPDHVNNKLLVFQNKYYVPFAFGSNLAITLFIGWLLNDYAGAFIFSWLLRMFLTNHCVWFINSLAHTWGSKTYVKEQTAVDNLILAFLIMGEGYHNYHHAFPSDYRNGTRWHHFDPTKWLIFALSKLGLANNLKKIETHLIEKKIIHEDKKIFLNKLTGLPKEKNLHLKNKINLISERVSKNLIKLHNTKNEYKKTINENKRFSLRRQLRSLRISVKKDWKSWLNITKDVMKQ